MAEKSGILRKIVPGEGPCRARVMIIGQNPGAEEEKQGRPFVGNSGRLLNRALKESSLKREDIYITNVVKFKTPENRKPTAQEIRDAMPELIAEIKQVKPEIIILLGEVAWQTPRFEGIKYIETYHPAAALGFPKFREKFEADFRELKRLIDEL